MPYGSRASIRIITNLGRRRWRSYGTKAFRYAGITLAIVLLIAHTQPAWIIAFHRFIEIFLGIATGRLVTAVGPESRAGTSRLC